MNLLEASRTVQVETVRMLLKAGMKQAKISEILEITPVCVSFYVRERRGVNCSASPRSRLAIDRGIRQLLVYNDLQHFRDCLMSAIKIEVER